MTMNKNYFIKIFLSSGLLILFLFFVVSAVFLLIPKITSENPPEAKITSPTPSVNKLILYSISGKIKSIENNKIQLETLTADSITKPLTEKNLEIRELEIGDNTKIIRLNFIPKAQSVKMPKNPTADSFAEDDDFITKHTAAVFSDLKIGDNISADYSDNLAEIKNFTPKSITVLPYSVY